MTCKLAPIQPTFEMIKAGATVLERLDDCPMDEEPYRARGQAMHVYMDMIEAAPNDAAEEITRIRGEAGVLRALLALSRRSLVEIDCEDYNEQLMLGELVGKIDAALKGAA